MAVAHLIPATDELVSLKEAVALLHDTPLRPSESTIRRWVERYDIETTRLRGGVVHMSFSDLLVAHRDEIAKRQAVSVPPPRPAAT